MVKKKYKNESVEIFYVIDRLEKICSTKVEVESLIGESEEYSTFCRKEDATSYLINLMRKRILSEMNVEQV